MKFEQFWESLPHGQKTEFAKTVGFSIEHLSRVATGKRVCSCELALAIERASKKAVRRSEAAPHVQW